MRFSFYQMGSVGMDAKQSKMSEEKKARIVILGGGFAGAYCAQALEKRLRREHAEIILIDRNNYFIFYPFLVEAGTGNLEPRHAVVSIRKFLRHSKFRMAEVKDVDLESQKVFYQMGGGSPIQTVSYDHLVVALGSMTNVPHISGLQEYGFQLKRLPEAVALRDRAIQLLEMAEGTESVGTRRQLLQFVVVGGNFTGVEVAGEFDVFLKQASRFYKNVRASDCRITLFELSDRILPALDGDLSDFAMEHLRSRGIDVRLQATISEIKPDFVVLQNGEKLPTQTVVWCAGISPNALIKKLNLPVDDRGYILCEHDLRVQGFSNVWAIGDCAVNIDQKGIPYPATAQHAVGEAKTAAKNIALVLKLKKPVPCNLSSKGALAALGCRTAVAKFLGMKLSGFPAWFLWRTVYLLKMPGWSRRLRIALDWTMDLFFKRDYVQLGVHRIKMEEETLHV